MGWLNWNTEETREYAKLPIPQSRSGGVKSVLYTIFSESFEVATHKSFWDNILGLFSIEHIEKPILVYSFILWIQGECFEILKPHSSFLANLLLSILQGVFLEFEMLWFVLTESLWRKFVEEDSIGFYFILFCFNWAWLESLTSNKIPPLPFNYLSGLQITWRFDNNSTK